MVECVIWDHDAAGSNPVIQTTGKILPIKIEEVGENTRKYNTYYFLRDYVVGITNNTGTDFLIDYDDYEMVCQYTWNEDDRGYLYTNIKNKKIRMHRLLLAPQQSYQIIDHINHDKLNNRRSNLRIVTNSQNQMNRDKPKQNTSGVKGVYWHKNKKKWQANIQIDNKLLYLGIFNSKQDAIMARKEAESKYFNNLM